MNCPIPNAARFTLKPEGTGANGVLVLGEAPGDSETRDGLPFRPWAPAGSVLERAFRRIGAPRESFVLWNTVPVQPPNNWLEGAPWCAEAVEWGEPFVANVIARFKPRCILALGNVAVRATTGLSGDKLGVTYLTGFVMPSRYEGIPVIPCFHPSYLRRGKMSHLGVLMRCLKLAIQVAKEGRQPLLPPIDCPPKGYITHPTEEQAKDYAYACKHVAEYVAYDIETPYSSTEDVAEEAEGEQPIKSAQFSAAPNSGIFLPWRPPFIDIAKDVLRLRTPKLGWNIWRFDNPILESNGCTINGTSHDLMWAWHHSQPDIPRNLQFASAQQGWPWPWKHLDAAEPQFYGIVDVDVLQWMVSR